MADERKLGSSAPTNRWPYFHLVMFLSYVRQLLDEHKLCSSAINVYSSVFSRRTFPRFLWCLFVTFGYLRTLLGHMCGTIDPGSCI
jgi:hypothetical protein